MTELVSLAGTSQSWRKLIPESNTAIAAVLLAAVTVVFGFATGGTLLKVQTLWVIQTFAPEILLITIAMGFMLTAGEMDLSVGSIYVVTGVFLGAIYKAGCPRWIAVLATLVVGGLLGFVNGLLVVLTKVTSFIVTLSTMWAFRGWSL